MNYIEEKYYTCKYDRAFKEIFLKEENKDMLKDILELILKVEIKKIELKPNERNSRNIKVKRKIYDALLETDIGKIEIEVNSGVEKYLYPRNMAYICDLYSHSVLVGETYSEETMIMQINFTYGKGKREEKIEEYKIRNKRLKEFVKNFSIIEINMDYYINLWYDKEKKGIKDSLIKDNKLLIMLGLEKEELEELSKGDKEVKRYMENLNELNHSPEFLEYMTYEEDQRKIRNSREKEYREHQENIKKGREELEEDKKELDKNKKELDKNKKELDKNKKELDKNKKELARNLISIGMDIEEIVKITTLSKEDIKLLK